MMIFSGLDLNGKCLSCHAAKPEFARWHHEPRKIGFRTIDTASSADEFSSLRADFGCTAKGNRMEFMRVRRNAQGGLDIYPMQDFAILSSAVWADGVAAIPAGATVCAGDMVAFVLGPGW